LGRVSGVKVASGFAAAALVFVVLGLDALWTRGGALFILFGVICLGASVEATKMLRKRHKVPTVFVTTAAFALYLLSAPPFNPFLLISALPLLLFFSIVGAFLVFLSRREETDGAALAFTVFFPFYIGGGLAFLSLLNRAGQSYNPAYPALFIFIVKANDICGYLLGSSLGRHKLHPVSPAKTVEGSLLGVGGGVGVAYLTVALFGIKFPALLLLPFALVCGVLGQMGDLGESLLKRYSGVKDSADLIPGSGGLFDFCDCFLLAAPVAFFLLGRIAVL